MRTPSGAATTLQHYWLSSAASQYLPSTSAAASAGSADGDVALATSAEALLRLLSRTAPADGLYGDHAKSANHARSVRSLIRKMVPSPGKERPSTAAATPATPVRRTPATTARRRRRHRRR